MLANKALIRPLEIFTDPVRIVKYLSKRVIIWHRSHFYIRHAPGGFDHVQCYVGIMQRYSSCSSWAFCRPRLAFRGKYTVFAAGQTWSAFWKDEITCKAAYKTLPRWNFGYKHTLRFTLFALLASLKSMICTAGSSSFLCARHLVD